MTVIVNAGSTVTVTPSPGLTLTADGTIAAGGLLQGEGGTISGAFALLNLGQITGLSGGLTIDSGSFDNQGFVEATFGGNVTIGASVNLVDISNGTLTAGTWYTFGGVMSLPGSQITTDDAIIDLSSSGTINVGAVSVLKSVSSIGATGVLDLSAMGQSSLSGPFVDSGVLSSSFTDLSAPGGLTVTSGGTLMLQYGSFVGALTLDGLLEIVEGGLPTNLPGTITGTGTIQIDSGAEVPIIGPATVSQTLVNNGNITLQNTAAATGVTIVSAPSGTGEIDVLAGTLELASGSSNTISYNYGVNTATVVLDDPAAFAAEILGMNNAIDSVVLDGIIGNTATLNGGLLSVVNGAGTVATLNLAPLPAEDFGLSGQNYADATFTATPNVASNNTTITVSGATATFRCFCSGTRIATPSGPVPVERLAAGDIVLTHFGDVRQIIWTGQRTIAFSGNPTPSSVWPVRIVPHAFGPDRPSRDLFLSPDHAVFVNDVLIPIRYLINGTTVQQVATDRVTYHHIELEEHDVVFAEGLAAESYLENGERGFFTNRGAPVQLFPDFAVRMWEMAGCAPLTVTGPGLDQVRARLKQIASGGPFARSSTREAAA